MKMTDIAKKANVSIATVSRVINNEKSVKEETRQRVLRVIEENEYTPSAVGRNLSKNETNIIAVVVPDISNPFFSEIVEGISQIADGRDLGVILFNTGESLEKQERALKMAAEQRVKGIIISVTRDSYEMGSREIMRLKNKKVPTILVDRDIKDSDLDGVFMDNVEGAYKGVKSLIEKGYRDIAIITGTLESKPGRDRLRGYEKALEESGIEIDEDRIHEGDFQMESGYRLGRKILEGKRKPRGIFVCNNLMTMGLVKAMNESRCRIPEDIEIAAFDRVEALEIFGIDINTVSTEARLLGREGAKILLERIDEIKEKKTSRGIKRVVLSPELEIKDERRS